MQTQELLEKNTVEPLGEGESSTPPTTEKEPEILIKRERYTIFHMAKNIVIFILIFVFIYFCSPVELVTISSSSMQPTLPVGSISIALESDEDTEYQVGDIVTFSVEYGGTYYSRITHRIVAIEGDTIQTKGDNNPENDPFTIKKSQIRNVLKWTNILKH